MKLAQILYSGLGGHGSVAFSLAGAAPDNWRQEMVFFGIEPLLPEYHSTCAARSWGQSYVAVRQGRPWASWRELYRQLSRICPEAIVLHSVKAVLPCWIYAKRNGIPLIAVEHQPNALKKRSEWFVSHMLMRLSDAVVLLTPTYRDELQAALGNAWRDSKVHLIPNGIDINRFEPKDTPALQSPIRVGMAARFSSHKRQDLIVGAMEILDREQPGKWRLSLAGDGDELLLIRRMINERGLHEIIELPGYLGEEALCAWFKELDLYVHASNGETLSTSILQALSCGLPILGSDVAGIANLLSCGGDVGICASSETAEGFADGLRTLAADLEETQRLSKNARLLACSDYSQVSMFERYRALIVR